MTDDQLTALAERFCATPLPWSVAADGCATQPQFDRTGTNLLTVAQAKEMLANVLAASPPPVEGLTSIDAHEHLREVEPVRITDERDNPGLLYTAQNMIDAFKAGRNSRG